MTRERTGSSGPVYTWRMLIGDDSPLRGLPTVLNVSQSMFFDGIRYSVDMADDSFLQCRDALVDISHEQEPMRQQMVAAFQSAWSFVDSINRLRVLLTAMRGVKRTPDMRVFIARLTPAEGLRNAVQHLPGTIVSASEAGEPTWGSLSWVAPSDPKLNRGIIFTAVPGSLRSMSWPAVNPLGRVVDRPVGLIELTAFEITLSISEVRGALVTFVPGFERAAEQAFEGHESRHGSDVLIAIEFAVDEAPT
jgi:hypothetical protein